MVCEGAVLVDESSLPIGGAPEPTFLQPSAASAKKFNGPLTWQEVRKHNSPTDCWMVIRGKVYDITEYVPRHPGGFMITLGSGRDATELFESHHPMHIMNNKDILSKFYLGDIQVGQGELKTIFPQRDDFYLTLKGRVEDYFRKNKISMHDNPFMYFKFAASMLMFVVFNILTFHVSLPLPLSVLFAVLYGYSIANIGMNVMHDGNHAGFSRSPIINKLMGATMDLIGASSFAWRMIHQVGHHVTTNVDQLDPDIATVEPQHFRRIKKSQSWQAYYQYQHLYLPFLYCLLSIQLYFRDFVCIIKRSYNGVKFAPMTWDEVVLFWAAKVLYPLYTIGIPLYFTNSSVGRIMGLVLAAQATTGYVLVTMFQVNHVVEKCTFHSIDSKGQVPVDWAVMQATGSANFAPTSAFWNLVSGGLSNQIEHHLFPTICHIHYTALSPIVKKACEEFNIPYNSYPTFWDALSSHFRLLKQLGERGIKADAKLE